MIINSIILNSKKGKQIKQITVLGIPFDGNSSFLSGSAKAPVYIREALFCESSNLWTENGTNLGGLHNLQILDDMEFSDNKKVFHQIEDKIKDILESDNKIISLGGDHSITYPIIKGFAKYYQKLNILHFDAHPDLYDELDGNRFSHACPFARIMEENLANRLVQVGIRTMTGHQREQALQFEVDVIEMKTIEKIKNIEFDGPMYLSLDLDCLDPAFAPGVSHPEPGGLNTRELIKIIQNLKGQIVGADIVEYNPDKDPSKITGMVAAKLLKEFISKMLEN